MSTCLIDLKMKEPLVLISGQPNPCVAYDERYNPTTRQEHCFHYTGTGMLMQYSVQCCHCSAMALTGMVPDYPDGHGTFGLRTIDQTPWTDQYFVEVPA